MAGPMRSRLKPRFMPHMGKSVPCSQRNVEDLQMSIKERQSSCSTTKAAKLDAQLPQEVKQCNSRSSVNAKDGKQPVHLTFGMVRTAFT